ncbi:MAG: PAS domain-containing protein [Candidatus Helarchaeota archaeon]
MLGYGRKEIKNISFKDLLSEEDINNAFNSIKKIFQDPSKPTLSRYNLRKKDGTYVKVETEGRLIYRNNKPYAILGIAREI